MERRRSEAVAKNERRIAFFDAAKTNRDKQGQSHTKPDKERQRTRKINDAQLLTAMGNRMLHLPVMHSRSCQHTFYHP
jgi:hypothetical protein